LFLRRIRPRGKGRSQEYWVLLESYRSAKGSRHRVVAYLGKLSAGEISGWEKLSAKLEGKAAKGPGLFDAVAADDDAIGETALVDLKNVQLMNVREFGQVWLAWTLWRMLGLDELLIGQMSRGLETVPWHVTAAILCIARFCHRSSELRVERHFYPRSALEDLLNVPVAQVQTDRLYRGLDQLLGHKKAIEQHLRQRMGRLFDLRFDILLYDLTSTYFEGQCADNDQAKRGYSRDNRGDCPQVVIALIVTTDGYPLGYEVFDGNTADSTTVQSIVEKVENEHGKSKRIWVMDRGNVSHENLAFIRERGGQYIVGTPKAMLRQVQGELTDQQKDKSLTITWTRDEKKKQELCGCYLLRTNTAETDPVKLWQQYIQLVDAEWAFRITKDELELRPVWHQNKERVQAHILVCFIAYAMWKTLGGWMKASGLGDSPRELLEEMAAVKTGDIILPTRASDNTPGPTLMIRCVTRPDAHAEVLLNRLGVKLPNHLKRQRMTMPAIASEPCTV